MNEQETGEIAEIPAQAADAPALQEKHNATGQNEAEQKETIQKKAAFVAVVGRPSSGKSTLMNAFCKEKVAIVSPVPQTTRNAIRGIVNREAGQIVFVDTPGRHVSDKKLNKKLMDVGSRAISEADLILYVMDASRAPGDEELAIATMLAPYAGRLVAAINKIDLKGARPSAARDFLGLHIPDLPAQRILEISALEKNGLEEVLTLLFTLCPEGHAAYPDDYYTDQQVDFRIAEFIREKAMNRLQDELPHALYVDVADTEFREGGKRLWVRAFIIVERDSQKGIVVGKGGAMIKAIRQAAQKDMDRVFEWKTELDLRVKVGKDWRQNDRTLKRLIES